MTPWNESSSAFAGINLWFRIWVQICAHGHPRGPPIARRNGSLDFPTTHNEGEKLMADFDS